MLMESSFGVFTFVINYKIELLEIVGNASVFIIGFVNVNAYFSYF